MEGIKLIHFTDIKTGFQLHVKIKGGVHGETRYRRKVNKEVIRFPVPNCDCHREIKVKIIDCSTED